MTKAAGILFRAPTGNVLLLRRSATSHDTPGMWDFPGGGRENDETATECAKREAIEEIGPIPDGELKFHTRTCSAPRGVAGVGAAGSKLPVPPAAPVAVSMLDVDDTTFVMDVDEEFTPTLSSEHDGWAWAPPQAPPQPTHPGTLIALGRFGMNELDVARAIADGRLTSPQRYENVWLWAIRVTGTGAAYRSKHDEFVIRKPDDHLTPEALARLNGLPVIFKHPPGQLLNSEEFSKRVVGTIFLPYVSGTEAWGIAKIFDDAANQAMLERDLSTSPGVNFEDFSVNAKITLEDKSKILIEGSPSSFDHVAICELGVWDKDGEPAGIRSESREDSAMAKDDAKDDAKRDDAKRDDHAMERDDAAKKDESEEKKEEEADKSKDDAAKDDKAKDDAKRDDADAGTQLEKKLGFIADSLTSMHKRMDAFEEKEKEREDARKRDDAKQDDAAKKEEDEDEAKELAAADKAKKDAKDDARKDARADSLSPDEIKRMISDVRSAIPKDANDDDYHALADAQARADEVFVTLGKRAPRPLQGETKPIYERRCVRMLKEFSQTWKGKDVDSAFRNDDAFTIVRDQVYQEAHKTGMDPTSVTAGTLRMIEKNVDGHTHRTFVGDPRTWMDAFAGPVQMKGTGRWHDGRGHSN